MNEIISKQEELLIKLNQRLDEIEILLIGNKCCENKEEFKKECLLDILKTNTLEIDIALNTAERIMLIAKGGER